MHRYYNPNPLKKNTGDCAVRAISKALGITWEKAKILIDAYSFKQGEVETSDTVWGAILNDSGFVDKKISFNSCTLAEFCNDHPHGVYVVKLPGHVVTVVDGDYYDSWDSGGEVPLYYWEKIDD